MKGGDLQLNIPAGFWFHPTDEELVVHYLSRRCAGHRFALPIILEIDIYKFDPSQLPGISLYGEKEWYFFSPRGRKYPNGLRPNRVAGTGYWKATGADKPVGKPDTLGIKKALVFYVGKTPRGIKTNWIMHEYRLANVDRYVGKNNNLKLDDWVLCRIYNKKWTFEKHYTNVGPIEGAPLSRDINTCKQNISICSYDENVQTTVPSLQVLERINNHVNFNQLELYMSSSSSNHISSFPEFKETQSEPELKNPITFELGYLERFWDIDGFGSHTP